MTRTLIVPFIRCAPTARAAEAALAAALGGEVTDTHAAWPVAASTVAEACRELRARGVPIALGSEYRRGPGAPVLTGSSPRKVTCRAWS